MNAGEQLAALAGDRVAVLKTARESNRECFPFAAEMLDLLRVGGMDGRIVYAENVQGETIGKRDDEGFARIHWQGYAK